MKLDCDTIVREAVAVMCEDGLAEVSLRKIAARFDATAPALKRHVGDKGSLLALMSHRLFHDALDQIPAGLKGRDWLEAFGMTLWRMQRSTPDVLALIGARPPVAALDSEMRVRFHKLLDEAGIGDERGLQAQRSIQALVLGWNSFATTGSGPARARGLADIDTAFHTGLSALIKGFGY
ncbi:TetR/AcrR family transcriptional regulator [Croceibacterium aestuarii]|uniref:TetR/AcrR family transcriptional regulator n=1 Tax=Croceibacterium aestuarii TaxID=3064139 RepID=UPI00272E16C5|nr:TetR family transcriptional regulator [Croceibacterium sp. D39]